MALSQTEVRDFLRKYVGAYEGGDLSFFDLFAQDATIFTVSVPTRIDGVEEFRRGFEPQFAGVRRRSQILSPEVRIDGDTAVVSFHNRIAVGSQTTNLRATAVLGKQKGELKILHLHNSPLTSLGLTSGARRPEDVTLLEERVATAAAAVGTPK